MAFHKAWLHKLFISFGIALALFATTSPNVSTAQDDKVDFVKDIKPLLEAKCMQCHNADDEQGGFRIDDRDELLDSWVYAGEGETSPLVEEHIRNTDEDFMMPPPPSNDGDGPLSEESITLFVRWIDEGANWPEGVKLELPKDEPDSGAGSETESQAAGDGEGAKEEKPTRIPRAYNPNVWDALGSLHAAAVHLPLGLLLAAGLFALLGLRGNFVMSDCAYYCLWLGTICAIFACVSGWWFSPMEGQGTVVEFKDLMDDKQPVFWHRTSALIVTLCAFLLALFAAGARNRDPDDGFLWKLGLILLAGGIGWVGHEGGKLTYGKNHYKDLNGAFEAITGWDADGNGVVDQWKTEVEEDANEDASEDADEPKDDPSSDVVGKTSGESGTENDSNSEAQ